MAAIVVAVLGRPTSCHSSDIPFSLAQKGRAPEAVGGQNENQND
jgi:hypothetical protein